MGGFVSRALHRAITGAALRVAALNRARMRPPAGPHPWLSGAHAPLDREYTLADLRVSGSIPPALDGRYVRIGPNPVRPDPTGYHWFLGDGMVHGVRLQGGRALWYRNRWVRSRAVSAALGEAPAPGPRNGPNDTVNTNVLGHAGATWALVEAGGFPVRLDAELGTLAHDPFGGSLRNAFSAHPHLDPASGELHAIAYRPDVHDTVWHVVVDRGGHVRREEPVPVRHGPMIHDCAITPRHVVVLDLPCTFSMRRLLGGHAFPYGWNPSHAARVGLLPREGCAREIRWCDVDPCYVFHPANACETPEGDVILDACVHDRMFERSTQGPDSATVRFERWRIDPVAGRVGRSVLDAEAQEFPRIDERLTGREHRYVTTVALGHGPDPLVHGDTRLLRHDLRTGSRAVHDFGAGRLPAEFVFVPRAPGAAEHEGWLMGYVLDTVNGCSELAILDAARIEDEPVARVHIPHRIPPGFHGNWVASVP